MRFLKYPLLIAVVISVLHLTAPVGLADEAAVSGVSGSVYMLAGEPTVSMVSEIVKIKIPEGKVSAQFVFKNNGPATTIRMGFPERATDFDIEHGDAPLTTMKDFESTIDSRPVTVVRSKTMTRMATGPYTVWWTKLVHFGKGQIHKVHDSYTGGLAYLDPDGYVGFHYILRSGASWQGSIGKATIICDIAGLKNHGPVYFQPPVGKKSADFISWHLTNLKPRNDIVVAWMNPFSAVSVNGVPVWMPADHGMVNVGTTLKPRLELDPFQFAWPADKWGGLGSKREGDDVVVSAKTLSYWLNATLIIGSKGHVIKISRSGKSVLLKSNPSLIAWGGGKKPADSSKVTGKPLFEYAQYFDGDSSPETRGYTALYLRRVVTMLGGTSQWDTRLNRLLITFPDNGPVRPLATPDISVAPIDPSGTPQTAPQVEPIAPEPVATPEQPATDGSTPPRAGF